MFHGETGVTLSFQATATDSADGPAAFMGTIDGADIEYEGAYTINPLMEKAIGPFTHYADIGNVAAAGSSMGDDSLITVSGSGADIWGTADEFHYLFREITGSFKRAAKSYCLSIRGWHLDQGGFDGARFTGCPFHKRGCSDAFRWGYCHAVA